ncbi:MAG: response regulator transcription factor [Roseivirga sp.]|nr:response regulator transcription factor [Roseivirga sp.]
MDKTTNRVKCLVVDDEKVARDIICSHLAQISRLHVLATCSSAIEALSMVHEQEVDLVFLDINMPELSGLSFAKSLNKQIKVIFTTAHREYAIEGFELQALDYLLKPISFERLFSAVNRYFEIYARLKPVSPTASLTQSPSGSFFFVKADRKMVKVVLDEVSYIESLKDYLKIHTQSGTVVTRETISNIEVRLPRAAFLRIHRSYIVAIKAISSFTHEYVEVGKMMLPVSRSYKAEVNERLMEEGYSAL